MESFDISINKVNIKSDEVNKFLNKGQADKAVDFIIERSKCSKTEADEVVEELKQLRIQNRDHTISNWNQTKESQSTYLDSTKRKLASDTPPKPHCPKCNSTSITAGQRGYKLMTGFLGSNKTVNRCANCGHSWSPGKR